MIYTPNAGFEGPDSFTYTVSDGEGGTDTATVNVTVQEQPNRNPNAVNDSATTAFETATEIDVLNNDDDPDGDPLQITGVTQGVNGSVTIDTKGTANTADDTVVYTPDEGFEGPDSFTYTVSDGQGGSDTATVNVTVQEQPNGDPVAENDVSNVIPGNVVDIDVLANDSDPDGDTLGITGVTQGSNGSVVIDDKGTADTSDDTVVYTPDEGFEGTDSFTYTVSDGQGGTDTATVDVNVLRPVVSISANKTTLVESEGDAITFTFNVENLPPEGVRVSVATYRPGDTDTLAFGVADFNIFGGTFDGVGFPGGFSGNDGFTFDILRDGATFTVPLSNDEDRAPGSPGFTRNDDTGVEQVEWRLVNFSDANPPFNTVDDYEVAEGQGSVVVTLKDTPEQTYEAGDDRATTAGRSIEIDVLANDNGGVEIVGFEDRETSTQGLLQNGTVSIDNKGTADTSDDTIIYTPDEGFTGTDRFAYLVRKADGEVDQARVTVEVTAFENADPDAVDDSATTAFETPIEIDVLGNDDDPDGDSLQITGVTQGANGSVVIEDQGTADTSDDTVVYTPDEGFAGPDSFTYTVSDGQGGSDTATVNVTVQEQPNGDPVAENDVSNVIPGNVADIDVLANDSDPDGDSLEITGVTQGSNGSVVIDDKGTADTSDDTVIYTPDEGFEGTDSFTYTVSDGQGGTDTATVDVNVLTPIVGVTVNETLLIEDEGTRLRFTFHVENLPDEGVRVNLAGYRPGDSGDDTLKFGIADFNVFSFPPVVSGLDFPPSVFQQNDGLTVTIREDGAFFELPIAADDPDRGPGEEDFTRNNDVGVERVVWRLVDFSNANPPLNTFDSYVVDPNAGEVEIILKDTASQTYEAGDDRATTAGRPIEIDVLANDNGGVEIVGIEDRAVSFQGLLQNGTLSIDDQGTADTSDDTIIYTPDEGFVGREVFAYAVRNADGEIDQARVTVDVTAFENADPDAVDDSATAAFETAVEIDVLNNDDDPDGDTLQITGVTQGANGSVVIDDQGTADTSDDTVVYIPDEGFEGPDSFTYTVSDGQGGTDTATINVTVEERPPLPVVGFTVDTTTLIEDEGTAVTFTFNVENLPPEGVTVALGVYRPGDSGMDLLERALGDFDFFPPPPNLEFSGLIGMPFGFVGNGGLAFTIGQDGATITLPIFDDNDIPPDQPGGNANTDFGIEQQVWRLIDFSLANPPFNEVDEYVVAEGQGETTLTLRDTANFAPEAGDDSATTAFETPAEIDVLGNDSDLDEDPLEITEVTQGANGSVVIDDKGTADTSDDTVVYTPDEGFEGEDSFTYTVSDGRGETTTATVTVTVEEQPNQDPDAVDDSATAAFETPVEIDVLGNDDDPDGDTLEITGVTQGANGSVVIEDQGTADTSDDTVVYTPDEGFAGPDSFTYTVSDGQGGTDTATVNVTVEEQPNRAPIAVDDDVETDEDTAVTFSVLGNDSDPDGDPLFAFVLDEPLNGRLEDNGDGTFTYTPDADFNGTETLEYVAVDDTDGFASAFINITVNPVNDGPDAADDFAVTDPGVPVNIDVLANDSDVEGDTLEVVSVSDGANGTVVIESDGTVTYTPGEGFSGGDTFTYEVSDGNGGTATATVTVSETPDPVTVKFSVAENQIFLDEETVQTWTFEIEGELPEGGVALWFYADQPGASFTSRDPLFPDLVDGDLVPQVINQYNLFAFGNPDAIVGIDFSLGNSDVSDLTGLTAFPDFSVFQVLLTETTGSITLPAFNLPLVIGADGEFFNLDAPYSTVWKIVDAPIITDDESPASEGGRPDFQPVDVVFDGSTEVTVFQNRDQLPEDNTDPDAVGETYSVAPGGSLIIDAAAGVLSNDTDADEDPLTAFILEGPRNGTLVLNDDGSFEYVPDEGFEGEDSFTYLVRDDAFGSSVATATIMVETPNNDPDAVDDAVSGTEDAPINGNVLADNTNGPDSDPDVGDILTVSRVNGQQANVGTQITLASGALLTLNVNGTFAYDPNDQFEFLAVGESETDSFTYEVSDGNGGTDTATVTVTIDGVNDGPTATDDGGTGYVTDEDTGFTTGNVLDNDSDIDASDSLSVESIDTSGTLGLVTDNGDGTFDYDPNGQFEDLADGETATDSFTYTVSDGNGGTSTATVTVTINGADEERNVVEGEDGNDNLVGTPDDDLLIGNGGAFDFFSGGGGSDIFRFNATDGNGREVGTITDYTPGEDFIDLGDSTVSFSFDAGAATYLFLEGGDFDTLIVNGASSINEISFV